VLKERLSRVNLRQRLVGICNVGASFPCVMPGLVPGIHDFKAWIAGTSPAMTVKGD
jgi:hypothetical protein